ncbi:hypothetical protein L6R52_35580 [Myxococcota bacterium]|nr:hypothetical protein [Myxococcota bacterium]
MDAREHAPDLYDDELLGLLLDEAERALLVVEGRADEPGRRILEGDVPDPELGGEGVSELRLAIAELVDAHPSIPYDLELISERLRNVGARAGSGELEAHPEVLDLVRLSLEVFVRLYPSIESWEADRRPDPDELDEVTDDSTGELYERSAQLLTMLRGVVS